MLEEDAARKEALERDRYAWPKPQFVTPQALRRLRLINALCVILAHAGCRASIDSKDLRQVSFRVGDASIRIHVHPCKPALRPAFGRAPSSNERIRLVAEGWPLVAGVPTEWQDNPDALLEQQINEVARDILVLGEWHYRAAAAEQHAWQVQRHTDRERQARELREQQEREDHERSVRDDIERRDWLRLQASNLKEARAIRALVLALDERNVTDAEASEGATYRNWRAWALGEANRLDACLQPLSSVTNPSKQ